MKKNQGFTPVLILVAVLAILAVGGVAYYMGTQKSASRLPDTNIIPPGNLIGGDKDAHGCLGSAGYSWCAVKNKCLRVWEEKCEVAPVAPATTATSEKQIGYIKSISSQNGKSSLVIDYVQKISCTNNSSNCPNGYKIVNDNTLLRTLPISSNVQVKLQTYSHTASGDYNLNQVVPLSTLTSALNSSAQTYPAKTLLYQITLNGGVVIDITEQYQP